MLSTLLRYAPVAGDLDPSVGVLDVGCGRDGLACVFNGARFAGQDVDFGGRVTDTMFGVRTNGGRFPWADGAFDTVVCVGALERLAAAERGAFIAECARVTAHRLLISAGPPGATELAEHCTLAGFDTRPWAQVNPLLASLLMYGDRHLAGEASAELSAHRSAWVQVLNAARFGDGPRAGFELVREQPREPLVEPTRFDASVAAALECVKCGTRLRLETAVGLRCLGCGRIPAREPTGTWDLTR